MNYRMMLVTGEIMHLGEVDNFEERGQFTIVQRRMEKDHKSLVAMVPTNQIVYIAEGSATMERPK